MGSLRVVVVVVIDVVIDDDVVVGFVCSMMRKTDNEKIEQKIG